MILLPYCLGTDVPETHSLFGHFSSSYRIPDKMAVCSRYFEGGKCRFRTKSRTAGMDSKSFPMTPNYRMFQELVLSKWNQMLLKIT